MWLYFCIKHSNKLLPNQTVRVGQADNALRTKWSNFRQVFAQMRDEFGTSDEACQPKETKTTFHFVKTSKILTWVQWHHHKFWCRLIFDSSLRFSTGYKILCITLIYEMLYKYAPQKPQKKWLHKRHLGTRNNFIWNNTVDWKFIFN